MDPADLARRYLQREPDSISTRLDAYAREILRWNRGTNLVSRRLDRAGLDGLILDSLAVAGLFPQTAGSCVDLGSGAGLPGVVLAVLFPQVRVSLVERRRKRAIFLEHVCDNLGLDRASVIHGDARRMDRAEQDRSRWPVVVLRAVTSIEEAIRLALPLVEEGGTILVSTGSSQGIPTGADSIPADHLVPGARGRILRVRSV